MRCFMPALAAVVISFLAASCASGGSDSGSNVVEDVKVDTAYSEAASARLIDKARVEKAVLTQADYAAMIEQCRAINRKVAAKLSAIDFKAEMTDAEIEAAMAKLQGDSEIPTLEAQSRDLLVILQNADLDADNQQRYASMVAEAEAALRSY